MFYPKLEYFQAFVMVLTLHKNECVDVGLFFVFFLNVGNK